MPEEEDKAKALQKGKNQNQHFSLPQAIQMIQPKVRKVPQGTGCCGMHVSMRCSHWTQRHLDVIEGRRKNSKLFLQAYFNYFACSYSSAPIPKLMFWTLYCTQKQAHKDSASVLYSVNCETFVGNTNMYAQHKHNTQMNPSTNHQSLLY